MMTNKSYSELIKLQTFKERYNYLRLKGKVGEETFGYDRILNQVLYSSDKWKKKRRDIIVRDNGCNLGVEGYEINDKIIIHHINPITVDDVINENPIVFDNENLISTSDLTHKAIHYSNEDILVTEPIQRTKNDTCPWKKR